MQFEAFEALAKRMIPHTEFMARFVGAERAQVEHIFEQLRLPIPKAGSFLPGTEGGLIFHTDAGVVIRAERKHGGMTTILGALAEQFNLDIDIIKSHLKFMTPARIDHEHILQPLVSLETDHHIIEIVPGRKLGVTNEDVDAMDKNLRKAGISFWDGKRSDNNFVLRMMEKHLNKLGVGSLKINQGAENAAYLPITTPEFPRGFPVIADRMAAGWVPLFHDSGSIVKKLFGGMMPQPAAEGAVIQKKLYAPLRDVFADAWPDHAGKADPEKMKEFWEKCHEFTTREITPGETALHAGWVGKTGTVSKSGIAATTAAAYKTDLGGALHR